MDLYDVLLVTKDASPEEIETAYRRRVEQLNRKGVVGVILKKFKLSDNVNYAYRILSDKSTREDYDHSPQNYQGVCNQYFGF